LYNLVPVSGEPTFYNSVRGGFLPSRPGRIFRKARAIVGEASMPDSMEDWPPPTAITTFADGDPAENPWVSGAPPVEAIEIAAYSPEWPVLFEASKELIARALPGVALNIEHVGSTAVPNLAAKPIIDMDLIVDDSTREETYVPALAALALLAKSSDGCTRAMMLGRGFSLALTASLIRARLAVPDQV
jgi:hypothetical protein